MAPACSIYPNTNAFYSLDVKCVEKLLWSQVWDLQPGAMWQIGAVFLSQRKQPLTKNWIFHAGSNEPVPHMADICAKKVPSLDPADFPTPLSTPRHAAGLLAVVETEDGLR